MIWTGRPRSFWSRQRYTSRWRRLRRGWRNDDPGIAPSQLYAWAALKEGIPFINGAPNLTVDIPAMNELSRKMNAPICGKDFKTGQTMIKSVAGAGVQGAMLGVSGWFSTNILGNRDGEVLDDPDVVQDEGGVEAGTAGV